jgi:hypothetical protein
MKFTFLFFTKHFAAIWLTLLICLVAFFQLTVLDNKTLDHVDFKDGVQNHLVFSVKGECFFVRPHTEKTVSLIRVADCDKK